MKPNKIDRECEELTEEVEAFSELMDEEWRFMIEHTEYMGALIRGVFNEETAKALRRERNKEFFVLFLGALLISLGVGILTLNRSFSSSAL